ncbi:CPBP family intramembrane glutamic endopeptidase [Micromonospora sp. NPDC006431]|uniref:CPBP family intramembrane glutamic endopeptidase n=1 Tax=Micromonospora sp. NPDC006431 TaxID=3364235 RepID=UPI0036AA154B
MHDSMTVPVVASSSRTERALTLGTALAIAVVLVPESPALTLAGGIALLLITLVAALRPSPAVLRLVICCDLVAFLFSLYVFAGFPPALVTTLFVVAPAVAGWVLHRRGLLRPIAPWLRWGPLTPGGIALFIAVVVTSVLGLFLWTLIDDPKLSEFLGQLQHASPWQAFAAILGFALVNSAWEELLFRGVLQTELINTWGIHLALVIESVAFGISHANGIPSGPLGIVMAGVWGYLLSVIRLRTGGIGYPFAAHVVANTTIGLLIYLQV